MAGKTLAKLCLYYGAVVSECVLSSKPNLWEFWTLLVVGGILQGISTGLMGEKMMIPIIFLLWIHVTFFKQQKGPHVEGFIHPSFLNNNPIPSIDIFHISFIYTCMYLFCIVYVPALHNPEPARHAVYLGGVFFATTSHFSGGNHQGLGYIHDLILGPPYVQWSF